MNRNSVANLPYYARQNMCFDFEAASCNRVRNL